MTTEPITPTERAENARLIAALVEIADPNCIRTSDSFRSIALNALNACAGIGVAASQPADPDDMLGSTCLFVAHPDGSYSPAPAKTIHAVSAQLAGNEPWPDDAPLNDDHELFVAWRSSQEAGFMEGGDEDRDWRVWQGARSLPPVAAPLGAAEPVNTYCWLVELFEPTGNSMGWYHTGFTSLSGQSRATKDWTKARQYNDKAGAESVAARLVHLSGTWRAVEHGIASTAPVVQPMPSQGASASPTALLVASLPEPEVSALRVPIAGAERCDERIPALPLGHVWVCSKGCGNCQAILTPFEYHRTETLGGELLESRTVLHAVSHCCNADLQAWDDVNDCKAPTPSFARGIDSPEGVETSGSTAQPQEPGPKVAPKESVSPPAQTGDQ